MRRLAFIALLLLAAAPAAAQTGEPGSSERVAPLQSANPETIQIGLSTNRVTITADFSGADLTIFGALDNIDPMIQRQGRYDVIVVLEGPARPVVVRRKSRFLGVWMNTMSRTFVNVPMSYSLATTRAPQDITTPDTYRQLALGSDNIFLRPMDSAFEGDELTEFAAALRDRKRASGLFADRYGGVQFLSQNLFRASLSLAPNVPVGTHRARAFLFRSGVFIDETSTSLTIVKAGFEQRIARASQENGLLYGIFAVLLAVGTGWLGRVLFRKD